MTTADTRAQSILTLETRAFGEDFHRRTERRSTYPHALLPTATCSPPLPAAPSSRLLAAEHRVPVMSYLWILLLGSLLAGSAKAQGNVQRFSVETFSCVLTSLALSHPPCLSLYSGFSRHQFVFPFPRIVLLIGDVWVCYTWLSVCSLSTSAPSAGGLPASGPTLT